MLLELLDSIPEQLLMLTALPLHPFAYPSSHYDSFRPQPTILSVVVEHLLFKKQSNLYIQGGEQKLSYQERVFAQGLLLLRE